MTVSNKTYPRLTWFAGLNLLVAVLLATLLTFYQVGWFWSHHMLWWFCLLLASMGAVLVFWSSLTFSSQQMQRGSGSVRLGFADVVQAGTLAGCALIISAVLVQQLVSLGQWLMVPLFGALLLLSITELPRLWQTIRQAAHQARLRRRLKDGPA